MEEARSNDRDAGFLRCAPSDSDGGVPGTFLEFSAIVRRKSNGISPQHTHTHEE